MGAARLPGAAQTSGKENIVTTPISVPRDSEKIHDVANGATQALDFVACPECFMPATLRRGDSLESTDGLVDHVRITCVNRHWFFMPADSLLRYVHT